MGDTGVDKELMRWEFDVFLGGVDYPLRTLL